MSVIKPFQQRADFCGAAALKMVLDSFEIRKTEKEIINLTKSIHSLGVEAGELLKAAKKFGLKGFVKDNCTYKELRNYVVKKKIPVIIEWFYDEDGHFSVVHDMDRENVYMQDPDLGHMRAMRKDLFMRLWFSFPTKYMRTEKDLILRRMLVIHR